MITRESPVEKANRLAKVGEAALRRPYPGAKVTFAQMAGRQFYRFEVVIPDGAVFPIEFSALDSAATGQTDEGWANAFLAEIEKQVKPPTHGPVGHDQWQGGADQGGHQWSGEGTPQQCIPPHEAGH